MNYIYSDEVGCELDGSVWNIFEKYDFTSEDELIRKFIDYLVNVVFNKNKKNFINSILSWAEVLGNEISIKHSLLMYEESVRMFPLKENTSLLEVKANGSKFCVHFENGFGLDGLDLDLRLALNICNAVRFGNLEEDTWYFGKPMVRAKGKLNLEKNNYYWDSGTNGFFRVFNRFLKNDMLGLDASFPSVGGDVSIDWMMRSGARGATSAPGLSHLTYLFAKQYWNMMNGNSPITKLFGEANWNAPSAMGYWYYGNEGANTLEKIFAPALADCACKN